MGNEQDLIEWRRYGHWNSRAAKARFAAYVLWQMMKDTSRHMEFAHECEHQIGDAALGLSEAFQRESAIALELVLKAVIANKHITLGGDQVEVNIPQTHDLPKLRRQNYHRYPTKICIVFTVQRQY